MKKITEEDIAKLNAKGKKVTGGGKLLLHKTKRPPTPPEPTKHEKMVETLVKTMAGATEGIAIAAQSANRNAELTRVMGESLAGSMEKMANTKPKNWRCTVSRNKKGLIEHVDIVGG